MQGQVKYIHSSASATSTICMRVDGIDSAAKFKLRLGHPASRAAATTVAVPGVSVIGLGTGTTIVASAALHKYWSVPGLANKVKQVTWNEIWIFVPAAQQDCARGLERCWRRSVAEFAVVSWMHSGMNDRVYGGWDNL